MNTPKSGKNGSSKNSIRGKVITFSVFIVAAVLVVLLYVIYKYSYVEGELKQYITMYGLVAVFVIAFLLDALEQPIGPELPLFAGIVAGLDVLWVVVLTILGSSLASFLSYYLGRKYGDYGLIRIYGEKTYLKWKRRYLKRSELVLALAALTPVPFVIVCWISGIFKMRFLHFFIFGTVARGVKIVMLAYIITLIL